MRPAKSSTAIKSRWESAFLMKIGYKRTDISLGFAVTVITIKLDAGYAQKVSILGTWVNIKYQQRHLCIKVLEKDFSSPGKVLEFYPGEPV